EQVLAPRALRELEKLQTMPAARRQLPPPLAAHSSFQSRWRYCQPGRSSRSPRLEQVPASRALRNLKKLRTPSVARRQQPPPPRAAHASFQSRERYYQPGRPSRSPGLEQVPAPRALRGLEKLRTTPAARRQQPPP